MMKKMMNLLLTIVLILHVIFPVWVVEANEVTTPMDEETTAVEDDLELPTDPEYEEFQLDNENYDESESPEVLQTDQEDDEIVDFTIEELGEKIVAAGAFWEDWWRVVGRFAYHMIDWGNTHPNGSYNRLLSSSGFENLEDIREFLSVYYTSSWIDNELTGQFPRFVMFEGDLFVHTARAGLPRPMWETASHVLIEQGEGRAVVDTTVMMFIDDETTSIFEKIYRFTLYNGLIDSYQEELVIAPPSSDQDIIGLTQETIEMMYAFIEENNSENPFIIPHGLTFKEAINRIDWGAGVTVRTPMSGLDAPEGMIWGALILLLNSQDNANGSYYFDDDYSFTDVGLFIEHETTQSNEETEPPTQEETETAPSGGPSLPIMGTTAFNVGLIGVGVLIFAGILIYLKRKK